MPNHLPVPSITLIALNNTKQIWYTIFSAASTRTISFPLDIFEQIIDSQWNHNYTANDADRIGGKSKITHFQFDTTNKIE